MESVSSGRRRSLLWKAVIDLPVKPLPRSWLIVPLATNMRARSWPPSSEKVLKGPPPSDALNSDSAWSRIAGEEVKARNPANPGPISPASVATAKVELPPGTGMPPTLGAGQPEPGSPQIE